MYIYLREEGTKQFRVFGPATYSECRAWLRLIKVNPREVKISCDKQLPAAQDTEESLRIE